MTPFGCCSRKEIDHLDSQWGTFELLSGEDKSLLIGRNAFLILDLSLNSFDGVRWLDVEGDGLSRQGLDENLHI